MASYISFKNYGETVQPDGGIVKPVGISSLARQSSVYSLTFDEFQNTLGGVGKDFGSMNMDELLKSIWTAEESQAISSAPSGGQGSGPGGNLQRQGSMTLPRTLSQKTVDEVWRDLLKESVGDGSGNARSSVPQRQPTLGEMTLEEFLFRAGVVREDVQPVARPNNQGFFCEISQANTNNSGLSLNFQPPSQNLGALDNQIRDSNNALPIPSSNHSLMVPGLRTSQQQLQQQPQPTIAKQANATFLPPMQVVNNAQLSSQGTKSLAVGRADPPVSSAVVQGNILQSGAIGMNCLGMGVTRPAAVSLANQLLSDLKTRNDLDTTSLSPSPYSFSEGFRGRKADGSLEKVVERRRRRMIKNRESAARSRARKQAYTLELEAELAKLKETNHELQRKQAEFMEIQKNQMLETMSMPWGSKRQCLRRTLTGPW